VSRYAHAMEEIERLLGTISVDELRHDVVFAESVEGKMKFPTLPSGHSFESHTRKARLWLDFIDELNALKAEVSPS
jgi:hypothetical protein